MVNTSLPAPILSPEDLARINLLVTARTGLAFGDKRRHVLEACCVNETRHNGFENVSRYISALDAADTNSPLWDRLIQAMTILETYFFRDTEQIAALRTTILPALIAAHQGDHTLRIWSAGCSTGEEPYTLAILLRQLIPNIERWKISLLATDLNKHALQHAASARYRPWSFRQTDPAVRSTYFTLCSNGPLEGELFELDAETRRMVNFNWLNLADNSYPLPSNYTADLDLILCRNVIIYLPTDVTQQVINRFQHCLLPGGWLVVGASEYHPDIYAQFQLVRIGNTMVYRVPADPRAVSPAFFGELKREVATNVKRMADSFVSPVDSSVSLVGGPAFSEVPSPFPAPPSRRDVGNAQPPGAPQLATPPKPTASLGPLPQPITLSASRVDGFASRVDCSQCAYNYSIPHTLAPKNGSAPPPAPEACLKHNARCVYARCQMARRTANNGRLAEAHQWAQQAIELDPLYAESYYVLGLVHDELGELDEAVNNMRKSLYLDPSFILANYAISALYQRMNRMAEAARHRAIALRNVRSFCTTLQMPTSRLVPGSDDMTAQHMLDLLTGTAPDTPITPKPPAASFSRPGRLT